MNPRFAIIILVVLTWSNLAPCGDIHDAAKSGDLGKVRMLLKDNPDLVFTNDTRGLTPLWYAASHRHKEVAELLLATKADVNATNKMGDTPLHYAVSLQRKDIVEWLLKSNAWVNAKNRFGYTPLRLAADGGHIDMMGLLLAYKADVNTRDQFGETPLDLATGTNVAKFLLANKADVNAKDDVNGWTPLHGAAFRKSKDVAELLLASNAVVNPKDNRGDTPLHIAVQRGSKDVAELLLANNADVNATNNDGSTPLQFGFDEKNVAALLRQHGGHGKENTTKPLVGWYLDGDTESQHDKSILDDYSKFIEELKTKYPYNYLSQVDFFEDGKGKHAVKLTLEVDLREYKEYYLMYNTNNLRTKVIKGKTWHVFHM